MKQLHLLAFISFGVVSISTQAAIVECLISGTPTPQEYTANFCSSWTSTTSSAVVFRLNATKPIASVSWSYYGSAGSWGDCRNGQYCIFRNDRREPTGSAEACATRVLYKDGTWENVNSCAYGMFYHESNPVKPSIVEISAALLDENMSY
ncbi:hypothetical protein L1077_23845 [Pseudoalteromonas luteoviolacea]|uniref:hypothetical protein n=1 Tax=Pseudoalteromonas luteoviolacea TaxID=43657 RepID=UPI001F229992|nr:hypothetical protein [Pseudoalteromonas luteoviolacea]MCF6442466.1 hypothetical protein [Pseudoalteromonas luteoviolacea]